MGGVVWAVLGIGTLGILVVVASMVIGIYNKLVAFRNRVANAWAQIDVQLKQRFDMIPNLVEIVKGYAKHEQETLERVIQARNAGMGAGTPEEAMAAGNMLTGALKSIFALAESYPELKANTSFMDLQQKLADTEAKIAYARQAYNDAVTAYNTALQVFPSVLVANAFRFEASEMYEITEEEAKAVQTAPKISF